MFQVSSVESCKEKDNDYDNLNTIVIKSIPRQNWTLRFRSETYTQNRFCLNRLYIKNAYHCFPDYKFGIVGWTARTSALKNELLYLSHS